MEYDCWNETWNNFLHVHSIVVEYWIHLSLIYYNADLGGGGDTTIICRACVVVQLLCY